MEAHVERTEARALLRRRDLSEQPAAAPVLRIGAARNLGFAEAMEELFASNGWPPAWRASIFTYHHYHSTAHETLGVARGSARLMLGGPEGREFDVEAGDVIVIPAGVAHRRLDSSGDFLVVGCYPPGQDWDLLRGEPGDRPQADRNIAAVPMPRSDPVGGPQGALMTHWKNRQITSSCRERFRDLERITLSRKRPRNHPDASWSGPFAITIPASLLHRGWPRRQTAGAAMDRALIIPHVEGKPP